ncbi:hypothetical protein FXO38_06768 [Capsicum annuum]|nr:hypothetical protein FXO38_06768 [Capsicum annuum]
MEVKFAEDRCAWPRRSSESKISRTRSHKANMMSNILDAIAQVNNGNREFSSQENEGEVVRMKIVVKKEDLMQVLEALGNGKNLLKGVVFEQKFKVECVNAGISKCSSILKRKKCSEDSNNTIRIQKSITFSLSDNGNNVEEESVPISKPKPQAATLTPKVNKKVEKKKSEVKTKKVASISFLGVLFFMVLFGGLVPLLNLIFSTKKICCKQILARPVGQVLLSISSSCKSNTTTAMDFKNTKDVSCKNSATATSDELILVGPLTRRKFKTSGWNKSEYFTSLEKAKNNKSHMTAEVAAPRGNLMSLLYDEFSQTGINFSESENSIDSPASIKVNALMADATDMDEKFAIMEQTIEVLKKSVKDKDLQIAQLMDKLESFAPGESSHDPAYPPDFTPQKKDVDKSPSKTKSQKEKQSTLVATLTIQ